MSESPTFCDAVHVRADRVRSYRWVRQGLAPVEDIVLLLPTCGKFPEWTYSHSVICICLPVSQGHVLLCVCIYASVRLGRHVPSENRVRVDRPEICMRVVMMCVEVCRGFDIAPTSGHYRMHRPNYLTPKNLTHKHRSNLGLQA